MRRLITCETRWQQAANRLFRGATPPPSLWPLLILNPDPILPVGRAKTPAVEVRVNHGVWQTVCPFCGSAQHASAADRVFYCAACCNHDTGNHTVPVKWPRDPDAIEQQLAERPLPRQRNWEPGETLRDLRREDEEARRG